jgi:Tfp pilus assembly protein PilX
MSRPGKDDGYLLVDAIVSLLITTFAAAVVFASVGIVVRRTGNAFDRALTTIEARNVDAEKRMGIHEPQSK